MTGPSESCKGMKAVVMAGGEGSRLRPLTLNRPKPLVPIGNRPIMELILGLLKQHGITEIVATLYYLADEIKAYFGDGNDFGVNLNYSVEGSPLGTAGSVKMAEDQLKDGTFIIISGDSLTDCDLNKAVEFHRAKGSIATLILYRVQSPLDFGVVITDNEGRVQRFLEKPAWSEVFSDTVNTGIYILEPEVFGLMEPGKPYDWSADIFPKLLEMGRPIYGYVMDGYWCDVGSLAVYRDANEHLLGGRVSHALEGDYLESQASGVYLGSNAKIDESVTLVPPVLLGRNVNVKAGSRIGPYTVLGDNTTVEGQATIDRTVIWDNVYIGHNASIHGSIIGSRAIIKRDCIVRENTVIGDRCLIDAGATIRPQVKIWPDKQVDRGAVVTMSLVWGSKWNGNLFRDLGVAGLSNIEITPDFACRLASSYGSCFPPHARIVTGRDTTRSSRMIKRAIIASLLSAGCEVLDLRSTAVPIARHFVQASGAGGAVHVRKLPGNSRVTLIELLDSKGMYLPRSLERKVENSFFREDYRRLDADDLGQIEYASRAVEGYQSDYFRLLEAQSGALTNLRIVCDYGFTSLAAYFPAMLARLGVESISLSAFDDGKRSPRTEHEIKSHLENLKTIVKNVGCDMGVLFFSDGERFALIDSKGEIVDDFKLLATLSVLLAKVEPNATIAMSVLAPTKLQLLLEASGCQIVRTKTEVRALMEACAGQTITMAGDRAGGFIFPEMQQWFDAPYCLGKLLTMLRKTGLSLHEVVETLPEFHLAYESINVPWEEKGLVMRRLAEELKEVGQIELTDGIKVYNQGSWALILPDSLEPIVHVYSESGDTSLSQEIAFQYRQKIATIQGK